MMNSEQTKLELHSTVPVIGTADIRKSIEYYTKTLGFEPDFEFGDPLTYAGVRSGEAEIYFSYDPDLAKHLKEKDFHPEIFIWLDDADGAFERHTARGAEIIEPVSDRPWGARQYVVQDINGYHLKFAQPKQ